MDITIKIRIDTGGEEPTVVAYTTGPGLGESERSDASTAQAGPSAAAPPADLLARAQAMGASNAGAAPADRPEQEGPPVFTGSAPPVAMDEASYEEGLSVGPTDVSAGAAPGTETDDDLAVVADAIPASDDDAAGGHTDAGEPTRRTARKTASRSTSKKAASRATSKK